MRSILEVEAEGLQKIRTGEIASKETLNTICKLLNCQPGDILEYIEETE